MDTPQTKPTSALAPFESRTFRSIWFASMSSNFGGLIQGVGAAWMMTSISDSANMVALVQASNTLPIMVLSLFAGAVADSFNRRRVMLTAQAFMLCVSATLALVAFSGLMTPWLLLTFTFLVGCGGALNNPSWQASVGDIVPRQHIGSAVALNSVGFNITRSVGPAIGGAIVATAGAAGAFFINALSYTPLLIVLLRWKPETTVSALPRESLGSAISTGLRYVAMSPNIGKVLLRAFIFGLSAVSILALLPLVARDQVQGGPLTFGILLGAFGVGAVCGAIYLPRMRARLNNEGMVRAGFASFAFCATITALSHTVWLTGFALMFGGAAWVNCMSLFNTTVQLSTPRWVVGRALSLFQMSAFGGMSLGSWIWGATTESYGLTLALLCAAALMLIGALVGMYVPLPNRMELDLDPLGRWREPRIAEDIAPRSGPVAITVDYTIPEESRAEFMEAMYDRRRIRIRDGARYWTLMRDMENPTRWVETFKVPTWIDYIRHSQRATKSDAAIGDRIRALNDPNHPPKVSRMLVRQPRAVHADRPAHGPMEVHH